VSVLVAGVFNQAEKWLRHLGVVFCAKAPR
jgi:hypothetical protein